MKRAYHTTWMVLILSNCDVPTQQRLEADWALSSLINSYRPILILLPYLNNLLKIAACAVFTLHVACKGIEQPFCHWQILRFQISVQKDILDYSASPSCCSLSQKTIESNKIKLKKQINFYLLSVCYKPCYVSRRVSCWRLDAALTMVLPVQSNSASSTKPRLSNKSWKSFRRYS